MLQRVAQVLHDIIIFLCIQTQNRRQSPASEQLHVHIQQSWNNDQFRLLKLLQDAAIKFRTKLRKSAVLRAESDKVLNEVDSNLRHKQWQDR